jgi:hypothetical protein
MQNALSIIAFVNLIVCGQKMKFKRIFHEHSMNFEFINILKSTFVILISYLDNFPNDEIQNNQIFKCSY